MGHTRNFCRRHHDQPSCSLPSFQDMAHSVFRKCTTVVPEDVPNTIRLPYHRWRRRSKPKPKPSWPSDRQSHLRQPFFQRQRGAHREGRGTYFEGVPITGFQQQQQQSLQWHCSVEYCRNKTRKQGGSDKQVWCRPTRWMVIQKDIEDLGRLWKNRWYHNRSIQVTTFLMSCSAVSIR